jgi:hypothetical protein
LPSIKPSSFIGAKAATTSEAEIFVLDKALFNKV